MSVGNIFGKHKLFQKRESIDAKRFVEIYYDFTTKKTYLENPVIISEVKVPSIGRSLYSINTLDFIPPRCKIGQPFEILYDDVDNKLYVVRQDAGFFKFMLGNQAVSVNGSDFFSIKSRNLIGNIDLELAETFNDYY